MLSNAYYGEHSLVILATKHSCDYVAKQNYQNVPTQQAEAGVGI